MKKMICKVFILNTSGKLGKIKCDSVLNKRVYKKGFFLLYY